MADEEELRVLHSLLDQRLHLDGAAVLAVARMSREQRAEMLMEVVAAAHADALDKESRR